MITQCIVGPAYTRVLFESKSEYIISTIHGVQIRIKTVFNYWRFWLNRRRWNIL